MRPELHKRAPRVLRINLRASIVAVFVAIFVADGAITSHGQVMSMNGMVVTSAPMAAQVGLRILQEGGNAFDAAVATAATMAVVEPLMSGLGGVGGYALVYDATKHEVHSLDFIGTAPAAAKADAYTAGARLWDRAHPARDSFIAPVVPGNLAGWAALHERYGSMPWSKLLAPAIAYARNGFAVTPAVNGPFRPGQFGSSVGRYPYGAGIFFRNGQPWPVADVLKQPDLARTFEVIAAEGPAAFYGGSLAQRFSEYFQRSGGILSVQDFADYQALWEAPLHGTYRGFDIYTQPPGGSGMTILQTLNILEQFDVAALEHNSPEFVHLASEAMKLAFVDEDKFNTGKTYAKLPLDELLSKAYAKRQASRIDPDKAQFYPAVKRVPVSSSFQHTTNHTVVDKNHNAVTITQTLMLPAGMVVPDTGVIFNNGMSYFSTDPTDINYIEPGQRPRFVMSPTIVMRGGAPYFALGSAGGWTIPQTIAQVIVRAIDYGMDAHAAVDAPRFVLQYLGNSIPYPPGTDLRLEKGFPSETWSALEGRGHRLLSPTGSFGMLNGVMIYPRTGALSGGADRRREGQAAGW